VKVHEATEIATLLNTRNALTRQYDAHRVLEHAKQYRVKQQDGRVVACAQLRVVQWYQWEVLHLSVHEDYARRGLGAALLEDAKHEALREGTKLLQCTIRAGNHDSERLFGRAGFRRVGGFHNERSGNDIGVWQYIVMPWHRQEII